MLSLRFPKQVVVSLAAIMIKAWAISVIGAITMIIKLTVPVAQAVGTKSIIRIVPTQAPGVTQTTLIIDLSALGVMPMPQWEAGPVTWTYTQ